MKKIATFIFTMLITAACFGEVSLSSITAQQRYPWDGKVDIEVQLSGTEEELAGCELIFSAKDNGNNSELTISHIEKEGEDTISAGTITRHFVWDADRDLGKVKIDALAITVDKRSLSTDLGGIDLGGVQLWEGGPYFAECNIGANKPEKYGYYFWWGDTVGYTRDGGTWINGVALTGVVWVSSAGARMSSSPFTWSNCSTSDKNKSQLQSEGYIDSNGNLTAAHDAATAHLGAPWRMPTDAEFKALLNNCDKTWTTRNGVHGRLITGRGAYSSKSIFLPAAGYGEDSDLFEPGSDGDYWSSTLSLGSTWNEAWSFDFASNRIGRYYNERSSGQPVRPVREATDFGNVYGSVVSKHFAYVPILPDGGPYTETVDGVEYTFTISDGEATIGTGDFYSSAISTSISGELVIPSKLGGCPVKTLGECAFYNCESLTSVTIPESVTEIEESAFDMCSSLTSITIPSSVTAIRYRTFYHCTSLTSVTIPDSVTTIENRAFRGCSSLTSVTIPDSVTEIEESAFEGCLLTTVTIPDSVTTIGESAFEDNSSLMSVTIGNGVKVIGLFAFSRCSSLTSVTIPDSVTTIGYAAFSECSSLASVAIGNGVTSIGEDAFWDCSSLVSITIPNSVTEIGDSAFLECDALTTVYVDDGDTTRVKELMRDKGVDVDALTFVELEPSVLPDGGSYTETVNGVEYTFSISKGKATIYKEGNSTAISTLTSGALVIPSTLGGCPVTKIGNYAFYACTALESVTIPDSVTTIGKFAFSWCTKLTKINVPCNVTGIGNGAFCYCPELTSFDIDEGNQNYCMIDGVIYSKDLTTLVEALTNVTSVSIPESVTTIGDWAFDRCVKLNAVTIPDNVEYIGYSAFYGCDSLTSVILPNSVTELKTSAFAYCDNLESVTISSGLEEIPYCGFEGCYKLSSVTIPSGVKRIGTSAFLFCRSLTAIVLPDSITQINETAFRECSSLTSITIPDGVTRIGSGAFMGSDQLASIDIPDSVTEVGSEAFADTPFYDNLPDGLVVLSNGILYGIKGDCPETVVIPEGVKSILSYAFCGQSSLTSITIPDSVTSIGEGILGDCPALTEIYGWRPGIYFPGYDQEKECEKENTVKKISISSNVTSIFYHDLRGYTNLEAMMIPTSVTEIEWGALRDLTALKTVYVDYGDKERVKELMCGKGIDVDAITFVNLGSEPLPDGGPYTETVAGVEYTFSISKGAAEIRNGNSAAITTSTSGALVIPSMLGGCPVTTIGRDAFSGCSSLTSVTIPDSVTTIGDYAFFKCEALMSVIIPECVTTISNYAFAFCTSMSSMTIPASVTKLGNGVIMSCFSMMAINVEESNPVYRTYKGVVYSKDMTRLILSLPTKESVTIPDGVLEVGTHAFYNCTSLSSIVFPEGLKKIGSNAFYHCYKLNTVVLPQSLTTIEEGAFWDCDGLMSVNIPSSVTTIGNAPFDGCNKLTAIDVATDNPKYCSYEHALYTKDMKTLLDCPRGRVSLEIPAGVETIAEGAFQAGHSLSSVTMPESLTTIEGYAFRYCYSLKSVTIPKGVTTIGQYAFAICTSLGSVILPDGLKKIESYVFDGCSALKSVTIPKGVTSIGYAAFRGCGSLTSVTIPKDVTAIGKNAFKDCLSLTTVYVETRDTERVKELMRDTGVDVDTLTFVERTNEDPSIEGDSEAEVTGDAETGFVVKPSEETTDVVITIPEGVDAEKVTIEVSPTVQTVKANGATIKVVKGAADITEFLDIPAAVDGVVNLGAAVVKEEVVKEALDTEKGAEIDLGQPGTSAPTITTAPTKIGLTYTLVEGATLDAMVNGDSKLGDGTKWTPNIKVKGGASGFYTIKVTK